MGTIKTTNIEPIANNGTVTLGSSGDTFTLGSGVTQTIAVNTPAFEAFLSSSQTFSDATYTKVNFDTEIYDTNSDYDNSTNYRFTPTVAGKYLVYSSLVMYAGGSTYAALAIRKNGSAYKILTTDYDNGTEARNAISTSTVIDFNGSSDYAEVFGYYDITSGTPTFDGSATNRPCSFGAYKIIE
jgi:hypothetical protein